MTNTIDPPNLAHGPLAGHGGVCAITVHVPGWTWQPMPEVYSDHRAARRALRGHLEHWERFADLTTVEIVYYGYDPLVLDDDGDAIGTDGYPDFIGRPSEDDAGIDNITWEAT